MMLILLGLSLGYLARAVFGIPASETENKLEIKPIPIESESDERVFKSSAIEADG
jgi:hypothetical protein